MKAFALAIALVLAAGTLQAGVDTVPTGGSASGVPRIPPEILLGIKNRVVLFHPGQPKVQMERIWEEIEAYQALKRIPNNPAKREAAEKYPFHYTKQLYLAQRPLWG
ncbi:hypothetical protein TSACC_23150 [Terrimicrobium sacchariphilum]|uniref:Uncharacterized protein n=1 Tax=Terrimicrobium sacchariphilum TaxID=690879 RepID=A0A146GDJ8_TERSA|nr:hypothetical protein [Terrimicrobium sacchariphilum]GAT34717.1 hypothetical protein TSACC_23150 [Terrimicrobium sacchariphilum]